MRNRHIRAGLPAVFAMFLACLLASPARAGNITLALSPVSGSPGGAVTVDGAIVNGSLDTVYLNGEDFTLGSTHLLGGDTTDFFLNAPISLAPGAQSGPIALFTFNIAAGTPGDEYNNNFLDIIGGTDPSDFTDVLAGSEYAVGVTSTPEAGTLLLLTLGLAFLLGLRRAVPAAR